MLRALRGGVLLVAAFVLCDARAAPALRPPLRDGLETRFHALAHSAARVYADVLPRCSVAIRARLDCRGCSQDNGRDILRLGLDDLRGGYQIPAKVWVRDCLDLRRLPHASDLLDDVLACLEGSHLAKYRRNPREWDLLLPKKTWECNKAGD